MSLTLFGDFLGLLAVLAADGERQSTESLFGDFLAALEAISVVAVLEARQRVFYLVERLGLHLNERQLDVFLDVGFRALDGVEDLGLLAAPRSLGPDIAHLALDLCPQFRPALYKHLLELGIARPSHLRSVGLLDFLRDRHNRPLVCP